MGDVILRDFEGQILSSFWQYGLVDWEQFNNCLQMIIVSPDTWNIYQFDESAPGKSGPVCPIGQANVDPGTYILLHPDGTPISVDLTPLSARPRHSTLSNTPLSGKHYQTRVRARDPCCLISGFQVVRNHFSRFKATHIFPRAYEIEWVRKGYPSLITDRASLDSLGGPSKIDSIQNVILLRSDPWDNYEFAVDPDAGYRVIPFVPGYDDIAGKTLKLNHITDPDSLPLDVLLRDHFLQGVLKNMKGAGEPTWDYEDALGGGMIDLSRSDLWGGEAGRAHLEFEMAHRLHSLREQESLS